MKPRLVISFVAAAGFHLLLLFGINVSKAARPLAMSNEPDNLVVDLVEASPEPPPAEPPPEEPPSPDPVPEVPPPVPPPPVEQAPEPMPIPAPVPDTFPDQPPAPLPVVKPMPPPPVAKPRNETHLPKATATPHPPLAASARAGTNAKPRYRSNPPPDYPLEARRLKQQGVVILSVGVNAAGHPTSVSLSRGSGFPSLDKAALDAVSRWSFEPAQTAGMPMASHVEVPVRFSLAR